MTELAVADQVSAINSIMEHSHRLMDENQAINLAGLEKMAGQLYETIARNPQETGALKGEELKASLDSMMAGLNRLEERIMQSEAGK